MGKENNIINALKRLERTGDENSRFTQKLEEATIVVSKKIIETLYDLPYCVSLPKGYFIQKDRSVIELIKQVGEYATYNLTYIPDITRQGCYQFAQDIADGLLSEIAKFMEERVSKTKKAIEIIENAHI